MDMIYTPGGMRIPPALPAGAYRTYQIIAPLDTHFRAGTCEEAHCPAYLNGFRTVVDEATELGQQQAHYIREMSGRRYVEEKTPAGLTEFTFQAGQQCFSPHQVRLERPEHFVVRDGDWRGNPTGRRVEHTAVGFWVEDFAEHQERINNAIERG
jgi:hypothetical protein